MNTPICQDFCTKEECDSLQDQIHSLLNIINDLSGKIGKLEIKVDYLEKRLESHIQTKINDSSALGHQYEPNFNLGLNIKEQKYNYLITSSLTLENKTKEVKDYLEKEIKDYELNAKISGKELSISLYFQGLGTEIAYVELPFTCQSDFDNHVQTNVNDGSNDGHQYSPTLSHSLNVNEDVEGYYTLASKIDFGNGALNIITAQDYAFIPKPNGIINIAGSYVSDFLYITVATATHADTATIYIPVDSNYYNNNGGDNMECDLTPVLSAINACCQDIATMIDLVVEKIDKNYHILGGDFWENAEEGSSYPLKAKLKAEPLLRERGLLQYSNLAEEDQNLTKETPVRNLLDLIESYVSVCYHRSGFHRLPAALIESLIKPSEDDEEPDSVTVFDQLSYQEWTIQQLDALFGQFPIKFDYRTIDANGDEIEQSLEIPNTSEALTQILGLLLASSENTDTTLNAVMRCLTEARSSANAAILAHDYAKANAEYLGYRGKQKKKDVDIAFTPGAKSLRNTLKPSQQKIIGWNFDDKESLVELIKKLIFSADIIKAALFIPFNEEGNLTGDAIKDKLEQNQQLSDDEWIAFKNLINNPTGQYQVNKPTANLKDLTIDTEPEQ
jgi:hypothetical protein